MATKHKGLVQKDGASTTSGQGHELDTAEAPHEDDLCECGCLRQYHSFADGPTGRCENEAHGWSCACVHYRPTGKRLNTKPVSASDRRTCDWCDKPAAGSVCREHFNSMAAAQVSPVASVLAAALDASPAPVSSKDLTEDAILDDPRVVAARDASFRAGEVRGRETGSAQAEPWNDALDAAAKVAVDEELWTEEPGRLSEFERRIVVGTLQSVARGIRALKRATPCAGPSEPEPLDDNGEATGPVDRETFNELSAVCRAAVNELASRDFGPRVPMTGCFLCCTVYANRVSCCGAPTKSVKIRDDGRSFVSWPIGERDLDEQEKGRG